MKIVVEISEDYYKAIKEIPVEQSTADMLIIRNGIPLPKGHGRLVDASALPVNEAYEEAYNWECGETTRYALDVVYLDDILNAQTIIEADGGDTE